ncbi:spiro-SPASM protein [Spirochaeta dissipatitropha]
MEQQIIICIYASNLSEYAYEQQLLIDGTKISAVQSSIKTAYKLQDKFSADIVVLHDDSFIAQDYNSLSLLGNDSWSQADVIQAMVDKSHNIDRHSSIIFLRADSPLYIMEECINLLEQHRRYFAHYSFCDGYPQFSTPEIISVEALQIISALASPDQQFTSLFQIIEKDLNAFDIETRISPVDFRLQRLELKADTKRNLLLCSRIAAELATVTDTEQGNADFSAGELIRALESSTALFRTLPASVNWILHGKSSTPGIYYPAPQDQPCYTDMPFQKPETVFKAISTLADWAGDITLTLSHLGEPAEYDGIYTLIKLCSTQPNLKLVIETDGLHWDEQLLRELAANYRESGPANMPVWIVFLDSLVPDTYAAVRPNGNLTRVLSCIELLHELFPGQVHIQAVRMNINEGALLEFYKYWKEKNRNIIIQKYNPYAGRLKEHAVSDNTPIERLPCWRLRRELTVLPDGSVSRCHVDLFNPDLHGNIIKQDPAEIWDTMSSLFKEHIANAYPEICSNCDEYYTYTF